MPRKGDFTVGLEAILNNPQMTPLKNPQVMRELQEKSGMSLMNMIRYSGRASKKTKEPSDKERSEARVEELGAKSEDKKD